MKLDAAELMRILSGGEGRQTEFKRGLPRDEKTARSLCAFANTRGGMLLIGVHDDGRVHGVPRPREVTACLQEICAHGIQPPLAVELLTVGLPEGDVVCCSVPFSKARPHAVLRARGEPEIVVRVGSSNRVATGASLRALREGRSPRKRLGALERQVLAWVGERDRKARDPGGDATVKAFAQARNVGVQRARRTFVQLERDGHLVAHGFGAQRVYALA